MTATMTKAGKRAPRKYTKAPMTLNQRLVLEALRRLESATVYEIADDLVATRDSTKSIVGSLVRQGFIVRTKECVPIGRGRTPAQYKWTGEEFPASVAVFKPSAPPSLDIALLVASMNAMVHAGRASV
jgi:predicted ArsR family transcriptional regulator